MRSLRLLTLALICLGALAQSPTAGFPIVSMITATSIADRPVTLDAQGKLLPWPLPDNPGASYSGYFLSQWTILQDQLQRQKLPYFYCCFAIDPATYELTPDKNWANSTGYLRAMMEGFIERLYPYTGDKQTLILLQQFFDYELAHGLTSADDLWPNVPYPSADPGAADYRGWSAHGIDFIEPHVVGEDGYAYLRLYEMTGNKKYLEEAIRCAEALKKNYHPGDATISPWPYRCHPKDGSLKDGKGLFPYSANVVEPIMLFDELIRLHLGGDYQQVRNDAWAWLMQFPMKNHIWVGYFEDVTASMDSMNNVIPLELARYLLLHPDKDPAWKADSRELIEWVKTTPKWPKYVVDGALITTEQGDGKTFCCNLPNQCCDSHSARLAATEAFYYAKTGDTTYKEAAFRTYNWVTYWQGLNAKTHAPFSDQWWFTDEFADGPRRMMDAFWAVPEWAPAGESHLLGSSSVVTTITYAKGKIAYTTFDGSSTDVLRLDFAPHKVTINGHPTPQRMDLDREGYTFNAQTRVMYLRHTTGREIDIEGPGGATPPTLITFDEPHRAAASLLTGNYPTDVAVWPDSQWQIAAPTGKFGTFNLHPTANLATFGFTTPQVFAGIDVYNSASHEASLTIRRKGSADIKLKLQPNELRRIRTGWSTATTTVEFAIESGEGLRFDNLAYQRP
jgi:hypothetical protein